MQIFSFHLLIVLLIILPIKTTQSSYSPAPTLKSGNPPSPSPSSSYDEYLFNIGLGVGLGFGIPLVLGIAIYLYFRQRYDRRPGLFDLLKPKQQPKKHDFYSKHLPNAVNRIVKSNHKQYAIFISYGASDDANVLYKFLLEAGFAPYQIYFDNTNVIDIPRLAAAIQNSFLVIQLQSSQIFYRPSTLIEIYVALINNIAILPISLDSYNFNSTAKFFRSPDFCAALTQQNPIAVEVIKSQNYDPVLIGKTIVDNFPKLIAEFSLQSDYQASLLHSGSNGNSSPERRIQLIEIIQRVLRRLNGLDGRMINGIIEQLTPVGASSSTTRTTTTVPVASSTGGGGSILNNEDMNVGDGIAMMIRLNESDVIRVDNNNSNVAGSNGNNGSNNNNNGGDQNIDTTYLKFGNNNNV
jgi:hypothetical protein